MVKGARDDMSLSFHGRTVIGLSARVEMVWCGVEVNVQRLRLTVRALAGFVGGANFGRNLGRHLWMDERSAKC